MLWLYALVILVQTLWYSEDACIETGKMNKIFQYFDFIGENKFITISKSKFCFNISKENFISDWSWCWFRWKKFSFIKSIHTQLNSNEILQFDIVVINDFLSTLVRLPFHHSAIYHLAQTLNIRIFANTTELQSYVVSIWMLIFGCFLFYYSDVPTNFHHR